jgi:hypothetical protein
MGLADADLGFEEIMNEVIHDPGRNATFGPETVRDGFAFADELGAKKRVSVVSE